MARDSLVTLDFVINVLREHEKELTELSERLENTLTVVNEENIKQTLNELNHSLQVLSKRIEGLRDENQRQKAQVNEILNKLETLPTKDDLENLRRAVETLGALLATKKQEPPNVFKD